MNGSDSYSLSDFHLQFGNCGRGRLFAPRTVSCPPFAVKYPETRVGWVVIEMMHPPMYSVSAFDDANVVSDM